MLLQCGAVYHIYGMDVHLYSNQAQRNTVVDVRSLLISPVSSI